MTLRHWQMEKVASTAEPLLSTTGNKGLNRTSGANINYDSTALFGKFSVEGKHSFDTDAAGSLSDNEFTAGFWFRLPSSGITELHYVFQLGKYNTDVALNGHTCVGLIFSTYSNALFFTTGYRNADGGIIELGSASRNTWYHCYISRTNSGTNSTLQVKITKTDGTVVHDESEVYTKADFSIDESGTGASSYFMGHPAGGSLSIGGGKVEDFILKNGSVLSYASIYNSSAEVFQSDEPQVSVSTGAGSATLSDSNFTGTKTYSFYDTDATTLLQSGTSNSYTSYASSSVAYTALVTDTNNNRVISTFFVSEGGNNMSILSGSVIVPVEAIGGLSASAGGDLNTYALPVAAQASADVAAGKALNSTYFTAGQGNKSILAALNSVAGSAGAAITITAGDGLSGGGSVAGGGSVTLAADPDDSSIGITAGGKLEVKTSGVSNDMLAGSIANGKLVNSGVSYGGVTLALGATDATPAFDLADATNYPCSSLTGTITNAQLAGSIANAKLTNSSVSYGGVSLSLGGSDATPAFDLTDATNYPCSSLTGTITNAQLAGSIANAKLTNSSVSYGGVSLSLGGSDATPAFDLTDATNYPCSSLTGTITNAQLAGSIANAKLANDSVTVTAGDGLSGGGAIALGASATVSLNVGAANDWTGVQKFDEPIQLKDQNDASYFKVDVFDGFLRVYAAS